MCCCWLNGYPPSILSSFHSLAQPRCTPHLRLGPKVPPEAPGTAQHPPWSPTSPHIPPTFGRHSLGWLAVRVEFRGWQQSVPYLLPLGSPPPGHPHQTPERKYESPEDKKHFEQVQENYANDFETCRTALLMKLTSSGPCSNVSSMGATPSTASGFIPWRGNMTGAKGHAHWKARTWPWIWTRFFAKRALILAKIPLTIRYDNFLHVRSHGLHTLEPHLAIFATLQLLGTGKRYQLAPLDWLYSQTIFMEYN